MSCSILLEVVPIDSDFFKQNIKKEYCRCQYSFFICTLQVQIIAFFFVLFLNLDTSLHLSKNINKYMTLTKYLLFFATMNCAFAIYFIALYDAMHSNMMKYVLQNIVKRNLLLRKTHCKTS